MAIARLSATTGDGAIAISRSYSYVYQNPWHYIWYWIVAVLYGAAVTFFVLFFTSLTVYVGKWAVGIPASAVWSDRKPDYLFIYAPESFGWRQLLTSDSPYATRGDWIRTDRDGKETTDPKLAVRKPLCLHAAGLRRESPGRHAP
jgi:hypothetical protein